MSEETVFKSLFRDYCENAGFVILKDYPSYEITDGSTQVFVRIIDPFVSAEIDNTYSIKGAVPKKIIQSIKKEFDRKKKLKKETDAFRFSRILLSCARIIILLEANPLKIVRIKSLLQLIKKSYAHFKIDVNETELFNEVFNSGLLKAELLPGRDPADLVDIKTPDGQIKRYALMKIENYNLVEDNA